MPITGGFSSGGGSTSSGDTTNQENAAIATGTTADAAATRTSSTGTMVAYLRGLLAILGSYVGATGAAVPTSADLIGFQNAAGNLTAISAVNQLPVIASVAAPAVAAATWSTDTSFSSVVSHVSKASAGNLLGFDVSSTSTALLYMQFFNTASAVASGATPVLSYPIPGAGVATQPSDVLKDISHFGPLGQYFSAGLAWGISTTNATYTAASSATPFNVTVKYV